MLDADLHKPPKLSMCNFGEALSYAVASPYTNSRSNRNWRSCGRNAMRCRRASMHA